MVLGPGRPGLLNVLGLHGQLELPYFYQPGSTSARFPKQTHPSPKNIDNAPAENRQCIGFDLPKCSSRVGRAAGWVQCIERVLDQFQTQLQILPTDRPLFHHHCVLSHKKENGSGRAPKPSAPLASSRGPVEAPGPLCRAMSTTTE